MPDNKDLKEAIQTALSAFEKKPLADAARELLKTLGYQSGKTLQIKPNTSDTFQAMFDPRKEMKAEAKLHEWKSVDLLFQVTSDEISSALKGQENMFVNKRVDNALIESYLFFAIELTGRNYSRKDLAGITREVNKCFKMPALIVFKHGETITFSIIARRISKKDESRDVLEKVTLIKDIRFTGNRAQIEILHDLAITQLVQDYAISNFVDLQHAWEKTLDLNELNKKFYKEIANWYFWAVKTVKFPKDAEKDEATRNATGVIRLITRLIFVWFIKEKGLIPEDLFDARWLKDNLDFSDAKKSTYYKAILQNLFFATLNTEMGADRMFRRENAKGQDPDYLMSNFYRYKRYLKNPEKALELFAGIPFLNGGLFECLDKEIEKGNVIRVDGFSDRDDNPLTVPDDLFLMEKEKEIDLNEVYDTKNKKYKVRGLIHIFNSYKFTIEENTPIEEEIALDPELLGKVFENLLAAYNPETGTTARKQTGSFYTPRDIVNYMVDEALLAYLNAEGGVQNAEFEERLRDLLSYNPNPPAFSDAEKSRLIAAIDNVKVLDPAAGSGAFPMGVLHKLVYLLAKLDPKNEGWQRKQISKANEIQDSVAREAAVRSIEEVFAENHDDYGRKLYLIENCIYGVDIQPIAVQIAKLRFFIALVVDQKTNAKKKNLGILPLPNLETKFVAANTLIGINEPEVKKDTAISMIDHLIRGKRAELKALRHKIFSDRTPKAKREHRQQDKQLRAEIAELLKGDWGKETAQQLAGWDPYNQNAHADFFDPEWMFGVEGGFDVVIGNPPYVRQEQISEFKPIFQKQYSCYTGTADLYVYFYERGIQALRENGVLVYISSNKYFRSAYGENLREYLGNKTSIINLIDFGDTPVFTAIAYPSIIITQKRNSPNNQMRALVWKAENQLEQFKEILETNSIIIPQNNLSIKGWRLESEKISNLIEKLRNTGKPLDEYVDGRLYYGLKTGLNEAFVIDRDTRDKLISQHKSSEKVLKPFIRGRDIKRWHIDDQDLWVIYLPWHFPKHQDESIKGASTIAEKQFKSEYPAIYEHLLQFKEGLSNRNEAETGIRYEWYALQRWGADYWREFEQPRIVWGNLSIEPKFAFAEPNLLLSAPANMLVSESKYLLGILNSKVTQYLVKQSAAERQGGFLEYKPMYVSQVPIPTTNHSQQIELLVGKVLKAKQMNALSSTLELEAEIDALVYNLYGLTKSEIVMIEDGL